MHITLNEKVFTTDGEFGELADIVVDPSTSAITHVVVQPRHHHLQARLVPVDLVVAKDDGLHLELGDDQVRMLQRVSESEYLKRPWDPIEPGPGWSVGVEHVLTVPMYMPYAYSMPASGFGWPTTVTYDRIPRDECEIALTSAVTTSDEHLVGHVETFIVDEHHVEGVVVQSGITRLRHRVAVPIGGIAQVRNDEIRLSITRQQFRELPILHRHEFDTREGWAERAEEALAGAAHRAVRSANSIARRVRPSHNPPPPTDGS